MPFRLDSRRLAGGSKWKAQAPLFFTHAHEVGHSSQSASISAAGLCNNLCLQDFSARLQSHTKVIHEHVPMTPVLSCLATT